MATRKSWKQQVANASEFEAWDRAQKRRLGFMAGLRFFRRHSSAPKSPISLMSRHWPHLLCWDWALYWYPFNSARGEKRRLWLSPPGGTGQRWASFDLVFGCLHLAWQDDGWMPAVNLKDEAPKIIWKHQMDTAPFRARSSALGSRNQS